MTTKKKFKNIVEKKGKIVKSSTNTTSFISKTIREIYPSLRNKPVENSECNQSYIDSNLKGGLNDPANKKKKFCQPDGGSKPIALEVSMALSPYNTYGIFNSVPRNKICCKISTLYSSSSTVVCSCFTVQCLFYGDSTIYLLGSASFI